MNISCIKVGDVLNYKLDNISCYGVVREMFNNEKFVGFEEIGLEKKMHTAFSNDLSEIALEKEHLTKLGFIHKQYENCNYFELNELLILDRQPSILSKTVTFDFEVDLSYTFFRRIKSLESLKIEITKYKSGNHKKEEFINEFETVNFNKVLNLLKSKKYNKDLSYILSI